MPRRRDQSSSIRGSETMPCAAPWPLADAVLIGQPLGVVLNRLMVATRLRLLVGDRIVPVSRPLAERLAPLLKELWTPARSQDAIDRICSSGDAEAVAALVGALDAPELDGLCARDAGAACDLQARILHGVAGCGCSWPAIWLPSGDQMRILGTSEAPRAGVAAAFERCRAHAFPVPASLIYLAGQVGGPQLEQQLTWVAATPAAALPGLPIRSHFAQMMIASERAWAIKALGCAGVRSALPLMRLSATQGFQHYDERLAGIDGTRSVRVAG